MIVEPPSGHFYSSFIVHLTSVYLYEILMYQGVTSYHEVQFC